MIKFTNFTPSAKFTKLATQYDKLIEDNKALGCLWEGTAEEQKQNNDLAIKIGYNGMGLVYPTIKFAEEDAVFKEYERRIKLANAEVALLRLRQKKYVIESKKNDIDNLIQDKKAIRPLVEQMIQMLAEKTEKQIKSKERAIKKLDGGVTE